MRISLCMIVLNEEYFLPEALSSAKPYVDEIIIVDTGSTDRTVSIARESGAKVISCKTTKLDVARNTSIQAATGDWILTLDADERMTSDHFQQLRMIVEQKKHTDALQQVCYNYFGEGLWCGVPVTRLFRRDPRIKWDRHIHETVLSSLVKNRMKIGRSKLAIHHLELDGPDKSLLKRERNIARMKEQLKTLSHPALHCLLGVEYFIMGEVKKAFEKCYTALRIDRQYTTGLYFLGQFSYLMGDYTKAKRYFYNALPTSTHKKHLVYHGLANISSQKGRLEQALKFTNLALKNYPGVHYQINKAFLLKKLGQTDRMLPLLSKAIKDNPLLTDDKIYLKQPAFSTWSLQSSLIPEYVRLQDKKTFWEKVQEKEKSLNI